MAKEARCPECGYETLVFEADMITKEFENRANGVTIPVVHVIHECPECDPEEVGDPLTDRTPRLELIEDG